MKMPQTLFEKVWAAHEIVRREDGNCLLWVDRHLVHEGSHHAFAKLAERQLKVVHPELTLAVADHYAPVRKRGGDLADTQQGAMISKLVANAMLNNILYHDLKSPQHGIVHVVGPELAFTLPGTLIVCGDSHTSTHGALGACGFGIGATEVAHVLATQTIWQTRPKVMRIRFDGSLPVGTSAKDMALAWISKLGADGARGHAVEYAGSTVRALGIEGRLTLCNMSIEGGARCGMIAPDDVTFAYLKGRPLAPGAANWGQAIDDWSMLATDEDAIFSKEVFIDAGDIAPAVTWGTSPDEAVPITANLPDPDKLDAGKRQQAKDALDYMGLKGGQPIAGTPVDQVFIGSCTNSRIDDLRSAAAVLSGRKAMVPGLVSPGSAAVKRQAEEEGLDAIFVQSGLEWADAGCSMCVGMNGDIVAPGNRCASTTNRNFRGRQGQGARTHLMSPAMVAAAAVTGKLTDVRPLLAGRSVPLLQATS